jgi:hypothetical protein
VATIFFVSALIRVTLRRGVPAGATSVEPGCGVEAREGLGDGRHVRQRRHAFGAGHRERAQLAASMLPFTTDRLENMNGICRRADR